MTNPDSIQPKPMQPISSGSLRLDLALGIGGLPRGQVVEISGPPESGKTTLCLQIIVEAQKYGDACAWIDADHTFSAPYAAHCGADLDQMYLCEPANAEQALEITETLARSGALGVIVLDSINTLVTQNELNIPLGELLPNDMHRLFSQWLHRLAAHSRHTGTTLIFTSRPAGQMSAVYHGLKANPARLALPMQAAVRLKLRQLQPSCEAPGKLEQQVEVKVLKNALDPYFKIADVDIIIKQGVNKTGEIFDLGIDLNLLSHNGLDIMYQDHRLGDNRESCVCYLDQYPSVADEIEQAIRQRLFVFTRHG